MEIIFFDKLDSTQKYLINLVKNGLKKPTMIVANSQSAGIGSRGNSWISDRGNLYFSFFLNISDLATDLKTHSYSIYFAYLLKEILTKLGSKIWIKWPNDFYIGDKKVGGVITNKIDQGVVCGIGINLVNSPSFASNLDIKIDIKDVLNAYIKILNSKILWKQIFSKFLIDFQKSKDFYVNLDNDKISLKDAILCDDGSIFINNKKVYSLR